MPRTRTTLFTPVNTKYGAPMGRPDVTEIEDDARLERPMLWRMERIRWTDGAYDQGGAYWGYGDPVYLAVFEEGDTFIQRSYRARSRSEAAGKLRAEFPQARLRGA